MNEFNSELSFQDSAQESKVKKLLNKAKIQGSMDFTFLSSEEQRQVKEWFQDHLKELDPEDRTEILENVLMREPVEETTVLSVISTLPDKQKQQLGEFLGFVLKDPSNAKAFQQCWHLFSPDQKDELVEFYTRKEPQNAIMVAKYVDVTKIVFEVDEKKETLMERSFQRKEQVHALLEQLTEESGNETSLERTERLLTLKLVVNAVSEKNPLFLVDYLDRLIPLNMVPKLIMDRILNRDNVWLLEKGKELLPEADRTRLRTLEDSFTKTYKLQNDSIDLFFLFDSHDPRAKEIVSLWSQMQKILITKQIQAAKHFTKEQMGSSFEEYLGMLKERDAPIFLALEELNLPPQDILDLMMNKSEDEDDYISAFELHDLEELLKYFSNKESHKTEAYHLILEKILEKFRNYHEDDIGNIAFVKRINSFLPYFSQEDQQRIIQTISEEAPDLWLYCWDVAVEQGYCNPEMYIDPSHEVNRIIAIHHKSIESYFRKRQEPEMAEKIVEKARNLFEQYPSEAIYVAQGQGFKETFPRKEDRIHFYQKHFTPPADTNLVKAVLTKEESHEAYFLIPKAFLEDPNLFSQVIDTGFKLDILFDIFSWETIKTFLSQQIEQLESNLFSSHKLIKHLSEDASFIKQLLKQAQTHNRQTFLAKILGELETHLPKRAKNKVASPSELTDPLRSVPKSRLESIQKTLKETLKQNAEAIPGLIFEEGMIHLLYAECDPYILRDIDQSAEQDPQILTTDRMRMTLRDINKIMSVIGINRYETLVQKHLRKLQFQRGRNNLNRTFDTSHLSDALQKRISEIDPIGRLTKSERPTVRFYDDAINLLASYKLFPLFEKKLKEISAFEHEQKAGKEDREVFQLSTQFTSLADQIVLFELSPLSHLIDNAELSDPSKHPLLKQHIQLITFLSFHGIDFPTSQTDVWKELEDRAAQKIQTLLNVTTEQTEHISELDIETIDALSTYLQLHASRVPALKKILSTVIQQVLGGTFEAWRMWNGQQEPSQDVLEQLKKERLLPKNLSLEQYKTWVATHTSSLEDEFKLEAKDLTRSIKQLIGQAIADGHIDQSSTEFNLTTLEKELKQLQEPLIALMADKQVLDKRITEVKQAKKAKNAYEPLSKEEEERYEELQQLIREYRLDHAEQFAHVHAKIYLEHLKRIDSHDLQNMSLTIGKDKVILKRAFQIMEVYFEELSPDFIQDLRRIQTLIGETNEQLFKGKTVSKSVLTLTDRIDAKTHLFIGEKPVPSCQSYRGTTENARGLASYLSDPNVKFIQLLSEEGDIQARAALRLLEDANGNPYLFMERVYSTNMHPKIIDAFTSFGESKAQQMGIPFCNNEQGKKRSAKNVRLFSHNSRAPYVYSDAGGGLKANGRYTIST